VTPTDTPTDTPTATPTITETFTDSPTYTATPTYTVTETFTNSPTSTVTLTATPSFTDSPTPTVTDTFTASPTGTVTPTSTVTPLPPVCETAFGYSDFSFSSLGLGPRWGWQITVQSGQSGNTPLYAGAGQDATEKGTQIGNLIYSYNGTQLQVQYQLQPGWCLTETHVYASTQPISNLAPGSYGNQHVLGGQSMDSYSIAVSGSPLYLVAHAGVCTCQR